MDDTQAVYPTHFPGSAALTARLPTTLVAEQSREGVGTRPHQAGRESRRGLVFVGLQFLVIMAVTQIQWAATASHAADSAHGKGHKADPSVAKIDSRKVASLVQRHLATLPGYEPGFIIAKRDVAPIFATLKKAGGDAKQLDQVFSKVVDDGHFLVRQLRSPQGQKFMRTVGRYPLNYDRMDRVSQAKGGQQAIINTVKLPDGASFWNPNAKPGFSNTAKMLPTRGGRRRSAAEFSRVTGKIYTEPQLIKQLVSLYQKEPTSSR